MAEPTMSREDASVNFEALMGGESAPATPSSSKPFEDGLAAEMRGEGDDPNASTDVEGSQGDALDIAGDVLSKLEKAKQDAGKAGYELGKKRKEVAEKDATIAALNARLDAVERGQSQQAPQTPGNNYIPSIEGAELDQFMSQVDPEWDEVRDDPYFIRMAKWMASTTTEAVRAVDRRLEGVAGGVQEMQFNQRLERLGIDRPNFDAIWQDPSFAWGESLTNDQRLAALESQAGRTGSRPSQQPAAGQGQNDAGARPTSRVNPRTIETGHAQGTAQNPLRLQELKLRDAMAQGDKRAASAAATELFGRI
jgi:hypothetical protein